MKNVWTKLTALVLCLLLCSAGAAMAEQTALEVHFQGLTAQADGTWKAQLLQGSFLVYQEDELIGAIYTDERGSGTMSLTGIGNALLVPDMDTMPQGYLIQESGYSASISEGRVNTALVMVYANAGLFTLQAEDEATFSLLNEEGDIVHTFTTDETGYYALPEAMACGVYVMHQESSAGKTAWADFPLEITPYRGGQVLHVDTHYAQEAGIMLIEVEEPIAKLTEEPTAEPTEVPTPVPTEAPTEAPTAEPTPEPTEEPTAEPTAEPTEKPTEVPTPEPTATPVTKGALALEVHGADVAFQVMQQGQIVAEDALNSGERVTYAELEQGSYTMLVTLPEGVVVASLNDYPTMMKGQAQWDVSVAPGVENLYVIKLNKTGALTGFVEGVADGAAVNITGEYESLQTTLNGGAVQAQNLCPGQYQVTVTLPAGEYDATGWTLVVNDGVVTAQTTMVVESGLKAQLPGIAFKPNAGIQGSVTAEDGGAMAGATVLVLDQSGAEMARVQTAADGSWAVSGLNAGAYTVQVQPTQGTVADQQVTLESAQAVAQVSAQATSPATLYVKMYMDANNNGERGKYERPVVGAKVEALYASTGAVAAQTLTNDEGDAALTGLAAGQYILRTEVEPGYAYGKKGTKDKDNSSSAMETSIDTVNTTEAFDLPAGSEKQLAVGVTEMASMSGKVWLDENGDGIMQADEPAQEGCLIELIGEKNGLTYTFTTDETGEYEITQIRAGNYKMRVTAPEGMMFTKYSKTGGANRSYFTSEGKRTDARNFEIETGDHIENRHVGLVSDGTIILTCFLDANYNGFYDEGEALLPGVELEAIKANGKTVASDISDENGQAALNALRTASYRVRALLPEGYAYTLVTQDPAGNQFLARTGRREYTVKDVAVVAGTPTNMLVGAVQYGSISGTAYLDDNFSATMDKGEEDVSGLFVNLYDAAGNKIATERTSAKGKYAFEELNPGVYRLELEAKHGYAFTKLGEGNVFLNKGNGIGETELIEISLDEHLEGMDIGMILPGTVQGSVFADRNDNGLRDADETGYAGVTVRLMDESGEWFSQVIGEDGAFLFDAVMPGRYYLRYDLPEDGTFAQVVNGGNTITGQEGQGAGQWFDFAVGSKVTAPLCGGLTLAKMTATVFSDHNGSGIQEEGENTFSGVMVELVPTRSDLEAVTTTSGADGRIVLSGLHPDVYTLKVTYPEGYVLSRTGGMSLPLTPGMNTQSAQLVVSMGDSWLSQPMGAVQPATIRGQAWLDENNNGQMDEGEAKPAGETVEVIDQLTGEIFTILTIDENGIFATSGVIPGSYTLRHGPTVQPVNGQCTFAYEDGSLVMKDVALVEGSVAEGMQLAVVRMTSLAGQVWVDVGGSVNALSGAQVTLQDAAGAQLQQAITADDGAYRFEGLLPGQYLIAVTLPEGQLVVELDDERITSGSQISMMQNCNGRSGQSAPITVKMGQDQTSLNIGSVLPGRLGDLCWLDLNGNGLQDYGEGGIPGVKIELMRGGEAVAETISNQYGYYLFNEVYPAAYTLRVTAPEEVEPTQHRTDIPLIASIITEGEGSVSTTAQVSVVSDKSNYNADLGFMLVKEGAYPAGYGEGVTQDWTKLILGED